MELFALIVKQDGGMLPGEKDYVSDFLRKQLPLKSADDYMQLFLVNAGPLREHATTTEEEKPSARDSIKILSICNTINKTISQEQKVIVLNRCFELVNADRQYTPQRMNVINTIAEVFRISLEEFNAIWQFVREDERSAFDHRAIKVFSTGSVQLTTGKREESFIVVLLVESVNLYFIRSFSGGVTLLNGLPMVNRMVYPFAPGSSVAASPETPVYFSDIAAQFTLDQSSYKLSFVAEHISYTFKNGVKAITDFCFSTDQGKTVGILGSSGVGKTTLLSILCGLLKPDTGDVRINSRSIFSADNSLDGIIGYVPQDNLLVEDLTVFENLFYAASLCFGDKTREERKEIVDQTLRTLGLYEKRNLKVGSPLNKVISGGQRKRLNIALELIREPSVLFLDEPTSGLSSRDSDNVMELMHDLARKGKLIISVVHQPSSEIFKSFDQVVILDHEGELVFSGNPIESVIHFKTLDAQINNDIGECPTCGTVNPETVFNILENKVLDEFGKYTDRRRVSSHEWAEAFKKRYPFILPEEVDSPPHSTLKRPGWLRQLGIYLSRDLKSKTANRQYIILTVLEAPILGLILSYIIRYISDPSSSVYIFRENENIPIYIFMCIIVALFLGLTLSAEEIFHDRKILKREHFLRLSRSSYLAAKISVLIIISASQAFLFLAVANPMLGIKGLLGSYWTAFFITSLCANLIGLNISSAFNSAITIYIIIPLLMIPMMVLSGAMFPFDKLNRDVGNIDRVPGIAELMPTRWTYEALMVRQAKDNEYDKGVYDLKKVVSISDFNTVYRIPRLNEVVDECIRSKKYSVSENIGSRLNLLRHELQWLGENKIAASFAGTDSLTVELFTPALGERLKHHLETINRDLVTKGNKADEVLDQYVLDNKKLLSALYNSYHNEKLEEIVRRVYEKNKMSEYDDRLIQNIDPIYLEPYPESFFQFRCHFLSPVKKFCGMTIDTFIFNNALVILSIVFLYLLLYFEVLSKIITTFEKGRIK